MLENEAIEEHHIAVRCAGWSQFTHNGESYTTDKIYIDPRATSCGDIDDGIAIRMGAQECPFVVSFEDFERVYLAAKAIRGAEKKGG